MVESAAQLPVFDVGAPILMACMPVFYAFLAGIIVLETGILYAGKLGSFKKLLGVSLAINLVSTLAGLFLITFVGTPLLFLNPILRITSSFFFMLLATLIIEGLVYVLLMRSHTRRDLVYLTLANVASYTVLILIYEIVLRL